MSRQCAADAIATSIHFLWKEALSITIVDPRGKEDSSISWNHFSKRELSMVPLYCTRATIEWPIFVVMSPSQYKGQEKGTRNGMKHRITRNLSSRLSSEESHGN